MIILYKDYNRGVYMKNFKKGFTLAEVLIALTILGIIAAIIIPSTINNHQRAQTMAKFKVATSIIENVVSASLTENGFADRNAEGMDATTTFNRFFRPYLKIQKDCGLNEQFGKDRCFAGPGGGWFALNNDKVNSYSGYGSTGYYKVVLANGMSMAFRTGSGGAGALYIVVDVDGPNRGYSKLGQDTFMFTYGQGGLLRCYDDSVPAQVVPGKLGFWCGSDWVYYGRNAGLRDEDGSCTRNSGNGGTAPSGANCSALLYGQHSIPNDYPWAYANQKPDSYEWTDSAGMHYRYRYNSDGEVVDEVSTAGDNVVDSCTYNSLEKKKECTRIDAETGDKLVYTYDANGSSVTSCKNETTGKACDKTYTPFSYDVAQYKWLVGDTLYTKYVNPYTGTVYCSQYAYGTVTCPKTTPANASTSIASYKVGNTTYIQYKKPNGEIICRRDFSDEVVTCPDKLPDNAKIFDKY